MLSVVRVLHRPDEETKMALDGKPFALEAREKADQAIQLAKLKLYTSSRVLELLTRGQAPVAIAADQLAHMGRTLRTGSPANG